MAVIGPGILAVLVSGLMLLSPASATVTGSVTYTHPFKSATASVQVSNSYSGCGKYTVQTNPTWSEKKGVFRTAATTTGSGCQSGSDGASAEWYAYLDLELPLKVSSSRGYTLNETWAVNVDDLWSLTPYSHCKLNYAAAQSECLTTAGIEIYSYTYLEDLNNYSTTFSFVFSIDDFATVENYSELSCSSVSCSPVGGNYSSGNLSGSNAYSFDLYNNFTTPSLNASHSYVAYIVFLVLTDAETTLYDAKAKGPASSMARFNMGSGGEGATLVGLSFT